MRPLFASQYGIDWLAKSGRTDTIEMAARFELVFEIPRLMLLYCIQGNPGISKIRLLLSSLWNYVSNSGHCDKQVTVVSLLLTTLSDGGHDEVLLRLHSTTQHRHRHQHPCKEIARVRRVGGDPRKDSVSVSVSMSVS